MELNCEFQFDAAHRLEGYAPDHPNARIHGHSFRACVTLRGAPDANGQIMDMSDFQNALDKTRARLDHHMLNEIDGLAQPTLENLCLWIWDALAGDLPKLARVSIHRDSLGQSCSYEGKTDER